jgi:hypothetical protein
MVQKMRTMQLGARTRQQREESWQGRARQGKAGQGRARQGKAKQSKAEGGKRKDGMQVCACVLCVRYVRE